MPGAVACIFNPATLEAEFRNGLGSIPFGNNSPCVTACIPALEEELGPN